MSPPLTPKPPRHQPEPMQKGPRALGPAPFDACDPVRPMRRPHSVVVTQRELQGMFWWHLFCGAVWCAGLLALAVVVLGANGLLRVHLFPHAPPPDVSLLEELLAEPICPSAPASSGQDEHGPALRQAPARPMA